ncbi:MAG: DUF4423 domain-containing protein [Polyangiaceae bacterium]|nr:DUF4423 domain-containing protein [Polyangiaceae bacterium]
MDHAILSAELVRALRGRRSQTAFSRRLGYKSNVVYRWEAGRAWPTAAAFFAAARRVGVDLAKLLTRFYRTPSEGIARLDLTRPTDVAALLTDLRGSTPIGELARRAHRSRFAVARWLKGEAEPRLPELLLMVDVSTLRLLDFVAGLVDPATLPSVREDWLALVLAREAAYSHPLSHAVLRGLELADYAALPRHEPGWLARRLGISAEEEAASVELLSRTKQIRRRHRKWVVDEARMVDTRSDPARSLRVKAWWTRLALDRVEAGCEHTLSYNLFSVSVADYHRIQELYRAFFQQMRAVIAESQPNERVVLFSTLMVPLEPVPAS